MRYTKLAAALLAIVAAPLFLATSCHTAQPAERCAPRLFAARKSACVPPSNLSHLDDLVRLAVNQVRSEHSTWTRTIEKGAACAFYSDSLDAPADLVSALASATGMRVEPLSACAWDDDQLRFVSRVDQSPRVVLGVPCVRREGGSEAGYAVVEVLVNDGFLNQIVVSTSARETASGWELLSHERLQISSAQSPRSGGAS